MTSYSGSLRAASRKANVSSSDQERVREAAAEAAKKLRKAKAMSEAKQLEVRPELEVAPQEPETGEAEPTEAPEGTVEALDGDAELEPTEGGAGRGGSGVGQADGGGRAGAGGVGGGLTSSEVRLGSLTGPSRFLRTG
ncbi:hypothetical protein ACIBJF_16580 [Streptomyces sp. NPDC050743]|uniref:hypothetical protein n=1 Tax=Streptomyces sp. NPDC050743 TaxID=3365634 RepID=UPI0037A37AB0